ncbi:MAG: DNA primase [Patescibacteria group bacterium]|jgi:DNA primase
MQPSDEIKAKLDIVDVIREYIQLRPAGMNFRANCPFHNEKTPSFMVSSEKQIWHCFGCGKGGDVLSFVMEMEGLSFVETLRQLAPRAGVVLKKVDSQITSKRNRILDILELSASFYYKVLNESQEARPASLYLKKRGLSEKTIAEWKIGYSPDSWDRVINLLKKNGYDENEIFLAGMATRKENGSGFYDRFRGRIMFPIRDFNGNVLGFSARVSPEKEKTEKMGKYINSPQTLVYDKSKVLFGLDKAKMEIKKASLAVVVEGQMDVITAHQAGFLNTIASSGTALTSEQVALLKRYTGNVALGFDMDQAGEMAAERGARGAMAAGMNISVVCVPLGKDPDECIRQDPAEWKKAIENTKPLMQYFFDQTFSKLDLEKVDHKREAARKLLGIVGRLGNRIEEDLWLKKLSQKIDVTENILKETLMKIKAGRRKQEEKAEYRQSGTAGAGNREKKAFDKKTADLTWADRLSELFLALLLKFPGNLEYAIANISPDSIGETLKSIYINLIFYYNNIGKELIFATSKAELSKFFYEDFKNWLKNQKEGEKTGELDDLTASLDHLSLLGERDYYNLETEEARKEILKISLELKRSYFDSRLKEIKKLITEAEISPKQKEGKEKEMLVLLNEFKSLNEEKRKID